MNEWIVKVPVHVDHIFEGEVEDVVGQSVVAELVQQLQVVQAVGHGEGLVGRHRVPVQKVGTVEADETQ